MKNKENLCQLFLDHYDSLKEFALKICKDPNLAEDVTQELYLDMHIKYSEDDSKVSNKLGFLFQAIKFASYNHIKKKRRSVDLMDDKETVNPLRNDFLLEELILESIADLPSRRRQAFYLRRILNYKIEDIAKTMDLKPKTVENHITAALKSLSGKFHTYKKSS